MYSDAVTIPLSGATMCCDSCPIEFSVEQFAVLTANGWGQGHNFQRDEFNGGQVIACSGHFSLVATQDPASAA